MSRWDMTNEQRGLLRQKLTDWFRKINSMTDKEYAEADRKSIALDLYNSGISPQHVRDILQEEFGYEELSMENNGWEWDYWIYFAKENVINRCDKLCVSGTGVTFELVVDVDD